MQTSTNNRQPATTFYASAAVVLSKERPHGLGIANTDA
jgi:hypothetical protein